jgi:hypothetical protein
MWESQSDFQGLWKAGFAFQQSVISTGQPAISSAAKTTMRKRTRAMNRGKMQRYGTVVLSLLTLLAVSLHPTPWCIGCETSTLWGHVDTQVDDVLQIWLLIAPFLAGLLDLKRGWLVPIVMVLAQWVAQPLAGEPWVSFSGTEAPFILLFGLPVCALCFLAGRLIRQVFAVARLKLRKLPAL